MRNREIGDDFFLVSFVGTNFLSRNDECCFSFSCFFIFIQFSPLFLEFPFLLYFHVYICVLCSLFFFVSFSFPIFSFFALRFSLFSSRPTFPPISQVFILVLYSCFPSQTFVSNSPFPSSLSFYLSWGTGHLTSALTVSLLFPSLRLTSPAPSLGPSSLSLNLAIPPLPPPPPRLRFTPHCLRG